MRIKLHPPQAIFELGHRSNQEDCIFPALGEATQSDRLFVLCDGMGGHERGEVASSAVCQGLSKYFNDNIKNDIFLSDSQLQDALEYAYRYLDEKDNGEFHKAGTTMTLLYFHRGGCTAAHIGDSRIYHFRPSSRSVLYKSRDHSLVFELYQAGEISYQEMKTHPRKNQVTKAMIAGKENRQRMDIVHIADILPDDYFLICSDGILEHLDDEELLDLLVTNDNDEQKKQKLMELTDGNADNHSAYLIHIGDVLKEDGDEMLLNDEQQVRFNAVHINPVLQTDNDIKIMAEEVLEKEMTQYQPTSLSKSRNLIKKHIVWLLIGILCVLATIATLLVTFICN